MLAQMLAAQSGFSGAVSVFWIAIALICIVPSVAYYLYKLRKAELDSGLKQTMLDRGMSVDEIERVLRATPRMES
jgi:hypothetical protein